MYSGIHFGLIDIISDNNTDNGQMLYKIVVRIIDHRGDVRIQKSVPLKMRRSKTKHQFSAINNGNDWVECVGIGGPMTVYRYYWFRLVMTLLLFVGVVMPMGVLLWLAGASVYYIGWGREVTTNR